MPTKLRSVLYHPYISPINNTASPPTCWPAVIGHISIFLDIYVAAVCELWRAWERVTCHRRRSGTSAGGAAGIQPSDLSLAKAAPRIFASEQSPVHDRGLPRGYGPGRGGPYLSPSRGRGMRHFPEPQLTPGQKFPARAITKKALALPPSGPGLATGARAAGGRHVYRAVREYLASGWIFSVLCAI